MDQDRIASEIESALQGPAWHGPSLLEALDGVTPALAVRRPLPSAHTIWEIVQHVSAWAEIVARPLRGWPYGEITPKQDWPFAAAPDEETWHRALAELRRRYETLIELLRTGPPVPLDDPVPDKDFSWRSMLIGAAHHALYHAGQVSLLKKP
jgi:hypothetical protein